MQGRDKIGLIKTATSCAKATGIDWEKSGIAQCVNGEEGPHLLRESIAEAQVMHIE